MDDGRIGIGIIGCGSMAAEHIDCLRTLDGSLDPAYCDTVIGKAEALLSLHGGRYATADPERLLSDPGILAVYILTHHDSHATLAVKAAEAGKHIFIEKPLARTPDEGRRIGEAVDTHGVLLMPGFKLRFYPSVALARTHVPRPHALIAQVSDRRWDDEFWANDPREGGGNVFSQGCHAMDLLVHLAGSEPVRVFAEGGNYHHPGLDIVDSICATVSFASGACASVAIGDLGMSPVVSKFSFQVMDGTTCAHLHDRLLSLVMDTGGRITSHRDDRETGVLEENRAFLVALRGGADVPVTWRDGLRALLMIEACFESIRRGAPVELSS